MTDVVRTQAGAQFEGLPGTRPLGDALVLSGPTMSRRLRTHMVRAQLPTLMPLKALCQAPLRCGPRTQCRSDFPGGRCSRPSVVPCCGVAPCEPEFQCLPANGRWPYSVKNRAAAVGIAAGERVAPDGVVNAAYLFIFGMNWIADEFECFAKTAAEIHDGACRHAVQSLP
jgi:hypothetical protein